MKIMAALPVARTHERFPILARLARAHARVATWQSPVAQFAGLTVLYAVLVLMLTATSAYYLLKVATAKIAAQDMQ